MGDPTDATVQVYDHTSYALQRSISLPCVVTPSRNIRTHGRFVFAAPGALVPSIVVLVQADEASAIPGKWGTVLLRSN